MKRKVIRFCIGTMLWLLVAVLLVFNSLLVWLNAGPRPLDQATPYIENAFNEAGLGYQIDIGHSWLRWEGWRDPIRLQLQDVAVITENGQVFSVFPDIRVAVDIPSLAIGSVLLTSIEVHKPVISLLQNADKSIHFGFSASVDNTESTGQQAVSLAAAIEGFLRAESYSQLRKLDSFTLVEADVSLGRAGYGLVARSENTNFSIHRDYAGNVSANAAATLSYAEYQSAIQSEFHWQAESETIDGSVRIENLMLSALLAETVADNALPVIDMPLSGAFSVQLDVNGAVQRIYFDVQGGEGTIAHSVLSETLKVDSLSAQGQISNKFQDVQLDACTLHMGDTVISAQGVASLIDAASSSVRGNVSVENVAVEDAHRFWPPSLSPVSREWVLTNVSKGKVTKAGAELTIQAGDLAKDILPKESVAAHVLLEGATVRYLPEHPLVYDVDAALTIDAIALNATISKARFLDATQLHDGTLLIPDLNADNPRIEMSMQANSTAKDAVTFLALPRLEHANHLGLAPNNVSGTVTAKAKVAFDFFAPRKEDGSPSDEFPIDYEVNATLNDVAATGFMQKFDLENISGDMHITTEALQFTGKGNVNGAAVSETAVSYLFGQPEKYNTKVEFTASVPSATLPRFGLPAFEFVEGMLEAKGSIEQGKPGERYKAEIYLANTQISDPGVGWSKPTGEQATLKVATEILNDATSYPLQFDLQGSSANLKGTMYLSSPENTLQKLEMTQAVLGPNKLQTLYFAPLHEGFELKASGDLMNISFLVDKPEGTPKTFSFAHFPAVNIDVDVGRLVLGKEREMSNVRGIMQCDAQMCQNADMRGMAGEKPFSLRIFRNPNGQRQISVTAENAGAFLYAADIQDGMEGGSLDIVGSYDDSRQENPNGSVLTGKLQVTDFLMKDAPIMGKVLSLASLTGLFDTLQGNGIRFDKLRVPFVLNNDVFSIKDAKFRGPSIGITVNGTITFPPIALSLNGAVVPAYALNNFIGQVPVVGDVLTGGKGEGVFATNYTVKGTSDEPDVSVNPLSMLTPGFLRNIFEPADEEAPAN